MDPAFWWVLEAQGEPFYLGGGHWRGRVGGRRWEQGAGSREQGAGLPHVGWVDASPVCLPCALHLQNEARDGDKEDELVELWQEGACSEQAQAGKEPACGDEEDERDDDILHGLQDPSSHCLLARGWASRSGSPPQLD